MHKTMRTLLAVALTLAAARAHATPATCTVTNIDVVTTLFPFPGIGAVGLQIPVDIDAAAGTITMDRSAYTAAYPSPGLMFDTHFGSNGWLDWDPGTITGTIDSTGQIAFPNFGMRFYTDYATPGQASLAGNLNPILSTAMQARPLAGTAWLFAGSALNAQGQLTLAGTDLINFVAALQTGPRLSCTLSPAPDLASLPKGPTLASAKGVVKNGTDPETADDSLTLTAVVLLGATPPVLDSTQDVLVRFQAAGKVPLTLLVPGSALTPKGKKVTAKGDGTMFQAIPDVPISQDDQTPPPAETSGGSLTVKKTKKRATFILKVAGIDASQLSGPVLVSLGVGTQDASRQVTFTATKKGSKFH